ncbi:hypothetical protein [Desulfosarcina widdelii]|uniref:hypothetical protein n=1 Tax=Desulfosarcina widdelii TaxID=947919 RepID=UPI0012D2B568|nr:hypothetical protein [Desulfosarcina widdelii]
MQRCAERPFLNVKENGDDIAALPVRWGKGAIERRKPGRPALPRPGSRQWPNGESTGKDSLKPTPMDFPDQRLLQPGYQKNPNGTIPGTGKFRQEFHVVADSSFTMSPHMDRSTDISVSDITAAGWGAGHLLQAFYTKEVSGREAGNVLTDL